TDYLISVNDRSEEPLKPGVSLNGHRRPEGFDAWYATNVYKQRQPGYVAATVTLPLGDASADQLRALADIARRFVKDTMRTTVEQNILFRWVSGCFNSCGQHHIADIGFYGINRNVKGFQVPHFQVILGGKFHDNAGEYGVPIGAVPSKRVPEAVSSITEFYVRKREKDERFQDFVG